MAGLCNNDWSLPHDLWGVQTPKIVVYFLKSSKNNEWMNGVGFFQNNWRMNDTRI